MKSRVVTIESVDEAINEKLEYYREWLGLGILDKNEMQEREATLTGIRRALFFKSFPLNTNQEHEDDNDFLRSDHCAECGGDGFIWLRHENPLADNEKEQCPTCEELHEQELRADRLCDEFKGD